MSIETFDCVYVRFGENSLTAYQFSPDMPDLPDATVTVAHGGQTGLKVFIKNLFKPPPS